jgi:hypothetical protein
MTLEFGAIDLILITAPKIYPWLLFIINENYDTMKNKKF